MTDDSYGYAGSIESLNFNLDFDAGQDPIVIGHADNPSSPTNLAESNFIKSFKWSPDGGCLMTSSNDKTMRIFETPQDALLRAVDDSRLPAWEPCLHVKEAEHIYDYVWYPGMKSTDPSTWLFVSCTSDHPIQMYHVSTGFQHATYSAFDHYDEITAPLSLCFTPDGAKLYCGFENMIRIFDVSRPGRDHENIATSPTRASKDGQKGLISCIDFDPCNSGYFAAGSYNGTVGIYNSQNRHRMEMLLPANQQKSGITQIKFLKDGMTLMVAGRKHNEIVCWDLRHTGSIVGKYARPGNTQQRIAFDVDSADQYLLTGDTEGRFLVHDLCKKETEITELPQGPLLSVPAGSDVVNCVGFHPLLPLAATTSGQRQRFVDDSAMSSDSNRLRLWRLPCHWVT